MDPVIIRAYKLELQDIFKRQSATYIVTKKTEKDIIYSHYYSGNKTAQAENSMRMGAGSHEYIELVERSNFEK